MLRALRPTLLLFATATLAALVLRPPRVAGEALAAPEPTPEPTPALAKAVTPAKAAPPAPEAAPEAAPAAPVSLNAAILDILAEYSQETSLPYVWSPHQDTDGVTRELRWQGTLLAAPEAGGGIHCSGITYEVYLRALAAVVGEARGPDAATLLALKETWYVRDGDELGPVDALAKAGLGERVSGLAAFKPGDIVQFWRNNGKGHSVIFINQTRNSDGSVRGMVYWSAQGTSGGIGMRRTSPGPDINQIAPGRLYGVRPIWKGQAQ